MARSPLNEEHYTIATEFSSALTTTPYTILSPLSQIYSRLANVKRLSAFTCLLTLPKKRKCEGMKKTNDLLNRNADAETTRNENGQARTLAIIHDTWSPISFLLTSFHFSLSHSLSFPFPFLFCLASLPGRLNLREFRRC